MFIVDKQNGPGQERVRLRNCWGSCGMRVRRPRGEGLRGETGFRVYGAKH